MIRAPHTLSLHTESDGILGFKGPTSSLNVKRLFHGAYEVRYDFSAYPVPGDLESAAGLLYCPEFQREQYSWDTTVTVDGIETATDGEITIDITSRNGLVEIRRRGIVVHGGIIGSSNTVLPRFPLRVYGTKSVNVYGKFNFLLSDNDHFFGLGDKGGDPDRRNRRFLMHNRDALGYRGTYSDPLYKSIPFVIKWNRVTGIWMGLAIMATDVTSADFGVESPNYYSFSLQNGPYRYVVMLGDNYRDILEKYTRLTGRPAFPPAFTFGFLGSSMDYTEPDDAADKVQNYLNLVEMHKIPCEGLYLSSGYCKAENGHRYAFEWNHRKFPDPHSFLNTIRSRGYHVASNIKPGILISHPRYDDFAENGYLVHDSTGKPYREYYWGEDASFWNFSSTKAVEAWKKLLKRELVEPGIDGIWNDNNEIEIEDITVPVHSQRSTFAVRMSKASYETLLDKYPGKRPWVISRSGGIGIQRYARTWSGDNTSDWESLRANNLMGLSMGLSGLPYFGHDIGGFFGDHPDSELFLRWCQSAVFQPRFVIHSWNNDGLPTELWSYEKIKEELLELVLQHYEFMPYIYNQAYLSHLSGIPMHRSPYLEFPGDNSLNSNDDCFLFGESILVILSLQPGKSMVPTRLPKGEKWYDPDSDILLSGGTVFEAQIRDNRARYLVREGFIINRSPGARSAKKGWYNNLHFDLYPGPKESCETFFEDDGESLLDEEKWHTYKIKITPLGMNEWSGSISRSDSNHWEVPAIDRCFILNVPKGFQINYLKSPNNKSFLSIKPPDKGSALHFAIKGKYNQGS